MAFDNNKVKLTSLKAARYYNSLVRVFNSSHVFLRIEPPTYFDELKAKGLVHDRRKPDGRGC